MEVFILLYFSTVTVMGRILCCKHGAGSLLLFNQISLSAGLLYCQFFITAGHFEYFKSDGKLGPNLFLKTQDGKSLTIKFHMHVVFFACEGVNSSIVRKLSNIRPCYKQFH